MCMRMETSRNHKHMLGATRKRATLFLTSATLPGKDTCAPPPGVVCIIDPTLGRRRSSCFSRRFPALGRCTDWAAAMRKSFHSANSLCQAPGNQTSIPSSLPSRSASLLRMLLESYMRKRIPGSVSV